MIRLIKLQLLFIIICLNANYSKANGPSGWGDKEFLELEFTRFHTKESAEALLNLSEKNSNAKAEINKFKNEELNFIRSEFFIQVGLDHTQDKYLVEYSGVDASLTFALLGMCFKKDDPVCLQEMEINHETIKKSYRSLGIVLNDDNFVNIMERKYKFETRLISRKQSQKILVVASIENEEDSSFQLYQIIEFNLLSSRPFGDINFNLFDTEEEHFDIEKLSNERKTILEFNKEFFDQNENMFSSVFKISSIVEKPIIERFKNTNLINPRFGSVNGTGFTISENGLSLTNYHVLKNSSDCMKDKSCKVSIEYQVKKEGDKINVIAEEVLISVYICSQEHDICLFKINNKGSFPRNFLKISKEGSFGEFLTCGFPADKLCQISNDKSNASFVKRTNYFHPITVESGRFIGLRGKSIVADLVVTQGGSGSPVTSLEDNSVVGIVSDKVSSQTDGGLGVNPGIALVRPISYFAKQYTFDEYISGEKENDVNQLIDELEQTNSIADARKIIADLLRQHTWIGFGKLNQLKITHPIKKIRIEIDELIKRLSILDESSPY